MQRLSKYLGLPSLAVGAFLLAGCGAAAAPPTSPAGATAPVTSAPVSSAPAKPSAAAPVTSAPSKPAASTAPTSSIKVGEQELKTLSGHTNFVTSLAFVPSGGTLASGGLDQVVKLWDVASGQAAKTLDQPGQAVNGVAFTKDGKLLASAGGNLIVVWDVASGKQAIKPIKAQTNPTQVFAAFSPDGKTLLVGTRDGLKAFDVASGEPSKTAYQGLTGQVTSVIYSRDGSLVAAAAGPTISLVDAASGEAKQKLTGHTKDLASVAFSPDGKQLASAGHDGIKLWDVASGKETKTLVGSAATASSTDLLALAQVDTSSVAYSPDGKLLVAGGSTGLRLWDLTSGQQVKTPPAWGSGDAFSTASHAGAVDAVAFSPDGKMLASGGKDKTIKLWQIG